MSQQELVETQALNFLKERNIMYDDTVTVDKSYYNKLKEQTTWISFKDRLPETHQRTLIYSKRLGYICGRKFQNGYLIPEDGYYGLPMSINYLADINAYWLSCPEPPDSKEINL